jgi:hypothetical protein
MAHDAPVGLLDYFGARSYERAIQAATTDPSTLPIASPWSGSSHLQRLVVEDVFGAEVPINSRGSAMRVPAVARGRNLLVSTISRFPLVQLGPGEQVPYRPSPEAMADPATRQAYQAELREFALSQPTWLYRTDDGTSPQLRLAWTIDDLIFYGASCWWRRNDSEGFPLTAGRVNQADWHIDDDNRVVICGEPQDDDQVIVFYGLHEGILTFGVDALRDARSLQSIVRQRLKNPVPQIDLHQESGADLTDDEIDALIERWATARNGGNGGVSFTSKHVKANEMGKDGDAQLMIEARNAAALDLARIIGVSANRLDATSAKASLNYETTTGRNQEFVDFDLALYMTPITARLSLDDCAPRGKRIDLDLSDFTDRAPSLSGPNNQD